MNARAGYWKFTSQNKVVDDNLHEHGDQTLLTVKRLDKD